MLFDTGTADKRRLVNVQAVAKDLREEINLALVALYPFTGCDTASAFVRREKVKPLITKNFIERFSAKPGEVLTSYNGVDMSLLPPCRESLKMHVRRANYQALIWKKADQATPSIPGPEGHGWNTNVEGELEICWTNGNLMPQELADIITDPLNPSSEDEDVSVDYEDISDVVFENDF